MRGKMGPKKCQSPNKSTSISSFLSTHLLSIGIGPVTEGQVVDLFAAQPMAAGAGNFLRLDAFGVVGPALILQPFSCLPEDG